MTRSNIIYMRTAQKKQDKIKKQREMVYSYLKDHPEISAEFEEIIDDGYSGHDENAPGLRKLLQQVEQGNVELIVVSDVARLSGDYRQAARYMQTLFPSHGTRLIVVDCAYDSADENSAKDDINLLSLMKNRNK